jgi:chemotaxis protein MotA
MKLPFTNSIYQNYPVATARSRTMKKFDSMTVTGLVLGMVLIIIAIVYGGKIGIFFNLPSFLIAVGGSFCAVLINFSSDQVKNIFRVTRNAFSAQVWETNTLVERLVALSTIARKEGLLALEDELAENEDPFFEKSLRLVIDGFDPDQVRAILEAEIDCMVERHRLGQYFFQSWGSFAPAFGMIGTLIGLVQMLTQLDDPSAIGPAMAVALLTTLYGALMAYLVFNPLAGKLALRSDEEVAYKEVMIEGVLAIQGGTNPVLMEEKLKAFIDPVTMPSRESQKKEVTAGAS